LPAHDLDLLLDAAKEAGKIASRYFRQHFDVREKSDGQGPVTEADLAIDQMLRHELIAARPDYGWLSEETEDGRARLDCAHVFIVDPIDGTRSFVQGSTTFAHSLAVARNGVITAAVVYLPERDLMFQAQAGQGAMLNNEPIKASGRMVLEGATILAAKPQLNAEIWPGGVPPVERHFRSSLAYRMCLIAQGRFDAMVTLRDAWEWDIAAGDLICREAGVTSTDKNGSLLRFNNEGAQTAGVLAASPVIHTGLIAHLHP
jgi:myo-inositol-1(or 4)-monophosphatase